MDGRMQNMSHIKQSASPAARRNFPDHKERVEGFRILGTLSEQPKLWETLSRSETSIRQDDSSSNVLDI